MRRWCGCARLVQPAGVGARVTCLHLSCRFSSPRTLFAAAAGTWWVEVAKRLPGRPENSVKNRWYSMSRSAAAWEAGRQARRRKRHAKRAQQPLRPRPHRPRPTTPAPAAVVGASADVPASGVAQAPTNRDQDHPAGGAAAVPAAGDAAVNGGPADATGAAEVINGSRGNCDDQDAGSGSEPIAGPQAAHADAADAVKSAGSTPASAGAAAAPVPHTEPGPAVAAATKRPRTGSTGSDGSHLSTEVAGARAVKHQRVA